MTPTLHAPFIMWRWLSKGSMCVCVWIMDVFGLVWCSVNIVILVMRHVFALTAHLVAENIYIMYTCIYLYITRIIMLNELWTMKNNRNE